MNLPIFFEVRLSFHQQKLLHFFYLMSTLKPVSYTAQSSDDTWSIDNIVIIIVVARVIIIIIIIIIIITTNVVHQIPYSPPSVDEVI